MTRNVLILLLIGFLFGCDKPTDANKAGPVGAHTEVETLEPIALFPEFDSAVPEPPAVCEELPSGLVACPSDETLKKWGREHHQPEPEESSLKPELDPPDPMAIRDGLVIYDELLHTVARRTRTHLEFWPNTPTLSEAEIAAFRQDPELWQSVTRFRSATPREQVRQLRDAIRAHDRRTLRGMLLRNGVFYVEDPVTAAYAARYVGLKLLFDTDGLELRRAGKTYLLARGRNGTYQHAEPTLQQAYAALHVLDRIGPPGTLGPMPSYRLQDLRRAHGLSNIVVGEQTDSGRAVTVRFFDGTRFQGVLPMSVDERPRLAVLGKREELAAALERNRRTRATVCELFAVTDLMVRERLVFDEPEVEYGQQDGYLRPLFEKAYAKGRKTYSFNGVTYDVFDNKGRPMVPQVCIDFITDAVDRLQGSWWLPKVASSDSRPVFDMRDYVPFRTVRSFLELGRKYPHVATVQSLPSDRHIPYARRSDFFANLWELRDQIRDGDALIIYGLRADNRNHFHSIYVRETDPVYGMPIVLTSNPGFARIQSWHDVMWESPKRSVQHIVRWNPDWLRSPMAVDQAASVAERARSVTTPTQP